ncbi:MAG: hypothetical protein H0T76_26595 [Nannocystis sp.]|nr:hypothetical protein [Nannocystis sp.]MBA3550064.1 hypothetical protein [Nannocystis sp.]
MPRRRKNAPRASGAPPRAHDPRIREPTYQLDPVGTGLQEGLEELHGLLAAPLTDAAGQGTAPVVVTGPIGTSALGRAWYRFVETTHGRLVSGRSYLRSGAVLSLQVHRGIITAEVQGTRRYGVKIAIALPAGPQLTELRARLGAGLTLRGAALHEVILGPLPALLPAPRHIVPFCQCMDSAPFCKHVCAALYGIGVRLDSEPELLLVLRGLAPEEPSAATRPTLTPLAPEKLLHGDLGALFGIELLASPAADPPTSTPTPASSSPSSPSSPTSSPSSATPEPAPGPASSLPDPAPALLPDPEVVLDAAAEFVLDAELSRGPAEIRRDYLRELGIPTPTIDAWLREGVLRRTGRHGVYERTPEAVRRIAAHLAT